MLTHSVMFAQSSGIVFHDFNQNGIQDDQELGIEGVTVSNGLNVRKTDSKGKFTLPEWDKARFITMYPRGGESPEKRYLDVVSKSTSYDFAVQKKPEKESVKFIQISDTETYEYKEWVKGALMDLFLPRLKQLMFGMEKA